MAKELTTIPKLFLLALATVIIGGILIKLDYDKALTSPNSDSDDKISFEIADGESVEQILTNLEADGLIKGRWVNYIKFYLRQKDLATSIQAGIYEIPKNLNIVELIETLQTGKSPDIWVTIPEGLRKDEIAERLNEEISKHSTTDFSKTEFLNLSVDSTYIQTLGLPSEVKDLEGYIFPDKYAFSPEVNTEEVMTKMVENFKTKVGTNDSYDDIIIASLIEREGYDNTDRPVISGIIQKRLAEGWQLGLDVSLLYYLKTWDEGEITEQDLKENHPYNTRVRVGLPPTPICSPGLQSINAMRNPIETEYYYFIRGNDSVTHYAVTYEQHLSNVANYLNN
jgi:UPF0755 protein